MRNFCSFSLNDLYGETLFHFQIKAGFMELNENVNNILDEFKSDFNLFECEVNNFFKCIIHNENDEPLENQNQYVWSSILELLYGNMSNLFYQIKFSSSSSW